MTTRWTIVVVYKLVKARQAAHWPSVEGVILKSGTRTKLQGDSQQATGEDTLAALKYQYQVAGAWVFAAAVFMGGGVTSQAEPHRAPGSARSVALNSDPRSRLLTPLEYLQTNCVL